MTSPTRRICPSCKTRLSLLAAECPECGLALAPPRQGRPMLFQASALAQASFEAPGRGGTAPTRGLTAPALGRVAPISLEVSPEELERADLPEPPRAREPHRSHALGALGIQDPVASFWPLVKVEWSEAILLSIAQGLSLLLPAWILGISPLRLLSGAWPLTVPYLFAVSWIFFMAPLVLTGQSPLMGLFGVTLPENHPERRLTFSLVHMLSVMVFPLSFICMLVSPRHQTLAELLSGQELLSRPLPRMR